MTIDLDRTASSRIPLRQRLACARALLDEVEAFLGAKGADAVPPDIVAQVADELARVASAMRQLATRSPPE